MESKGIEAVNASIYIRHELPLVSPDALKLHHTIDTNSQVVRDALGQANAHRFVDHQSAREAKLNTAREMKQEQARQVAFDALVRRRTAHK